MRAQRLKITLESLNCLLQSNLYVPCKKKLVVIVICSSLKTFSFIFLFLAELMVDKAMELKYIGGVFGGNIKPTPFLCLVLKMLQIQPEKDIVVEFIKNEDFK